jgi:hypothetical protein
VRILAALGGNALLRRGEPMTADTQRANVQVAAAALAAIHPGNELVITHGNGPQVGLLALQGAACRMLAHPPAVRRFRPEAYSADDGGRAARRRCSHGGVRVARSAGSALVRLRESLLPLAERSAAR